MLFNEIIDTHGIDGVASKTNISAINLGYLVDEDFGKLNRVKALGFLLILEREYTEIDVSALRDRIKAYYDEHKPADEKVVMVAKDSVEGGSNFSFFKFFIILTLLGGGFYLYTQGKFDSLMQNIEEKQEFFDDKKALENNVSDENAEKVVVGKSSEESISIETPIAPKMETIVLTDESSVKKDTNHTLNRAVNIEKFSPKNEAVDMPKSVETVVREVTEEFLANENNISHEINENTEEALSNATITTVNINPTRGMLWFGFINLDTKKRREFMKTVSTPFNIDNARWLLVTGHGYLDVVAGDKTLDLSDNKKHYFYIDGTELREIDKKEFRKLNGRRGW
ncbi:MAG: Membrane protein [uncultured Sulfurovum sp.]|uniref:Membrane protein n=1 Tax=uncultured Sulfurovum sp. TaxID=269237 RepID=A0A6S6S9Z2_9BACT|nr:MAG: Membrane protein [uncultured Sulfurovum sp.]